MFLSALATGGCAVALWFLFIVFGADQVMTDKITIVMINHSGHQLSMEMNGARAELYPDQACVIRYPTNCNKVILRTDKGEIWTFGNIIPAERLATRPVTLFQVEPDGKIYLVPSSTDKPLQDLPSQPPGFPIAPEVEKKREAKTKSAMPEWDDPESTDGVRHRPLTAAIGEEKGVGRRRELSLAPSRYVRRPFLRCFGHEHH
jgi:hypothetical protein